jgi:diguanylate cyclase (GGDEF)-like protein
MPHRPDPTTLPTPFAARETPVVPAMAHRAAAPAAPFSVPLRTLALLFVVGSVVVAGLLGFAIAAWFQPVTPWAAALAAAVGVLFTALPLGAALLGLARRADLPQAPADAAAHGAETGAATAASAAGVNQGVALSRELFMDMVSREWARARRYGTGAALLLVEIDRFPRLADALGDAAGEKVLADLLGSTAPSLRGADALAPYGPGQFAVFLAHADATGALDVAERIRERAEQMEVPVPPRRVRFTVSVGVAQLRPTHLYLQALLDDVSDALSAARAVGGNCVRAAPVDIGQRPAPGAARDGSRADKK